MSLRSSKSFANELGSSPAQSHSSAEGSLCMRAVSMMCSFVAAFCCSLARSFSLSHSLRLWEECRLSGFGAMRLRLLTVEHVD